MYNSVHQNTWGFAAPSRHRLALSITWDAEGLPCSHPILAKLR
jgi:hypothetical protein